MKKLEVKVVPNTGTGELHSFEVEVNEGKRCIVTIPVDKNLQVTAANMKMTKQILTAVFGENNFAVFGIPSDTKIEVYEVEVGKDPDAADRV